MLYWKGRIEHRIDSFCLMSYPDIYPTLLDMMGLKSKIPASVEGKSRASYLLTQKGEFPAAQYFMGNIQAPDSTGGFRGIRTQRFKLAFQRNKDGVMENFLFDLKHDPFEMNNLYGKFPHVTDSLRNELIGWLRQTRDPFLRNMK